MTYRNKDSFIEEIIRELLRWEFFTKLDEAVEMDKAVYFPTQKIRQYAEKIKKYQDGEIDRVEDY